ncbi:polysaccharide biosynthesis tyrosine autokinase [Rhizobium sp. XQZ8]|uniref:polysaccharide biosynthesis tyrosine autokinase n=1 Tax=Rhizobium populisoli TaxID=2859785 RepID=UPI001CA566A2|nr:polysaccharide biosynthesis tyrosine autokinase [Rhizobium populisoli]MBW6426041.1 polysaccharide biosynthesis tyrosine autokinase [Rhizobium populisoli]
MDEADRSASSDLIDFEALVGVARRQWFVLLCAMGVGAIFGFAYLLTAVPYYSSSVTVLIDRGNTQLAGQLSSIGGAVLDDEGSVLSQVEVFRSDTIALSVVDKLNLVGDPVFQVTPGSLPTKVLNAIRSLSDVSGWFASDNVPENDLASKRQAAAEKLLEELDVTRVGRTYVLKLDYLSPSSELAAKIANAFGDAYLIDKLNSKYDATRRASDWLQDRIAELRQKSVDSDLAVQKFRTANGLVSAGSVLVADQQLSELNSALIVAQSDSAKAEARLQRIQQIIASGQGDAVVTDVLASTVSNELRQKYLDASKREAQITARLGANHIQAIRLRSEMSEYQRLMFEELNRIAESYKSDLNVAKAREKSLTESVAQATGISATANETQVQLRELERESETYKNLYQTFLQRYQEAVQQQSFPVTEARIITRASPATAPSHPRKGVVLALFCVIGAAVGSGLGAFREFRDRFFRTGDHVRNTLGLEFLGTAPLVSGTRIASAEQISHPQSIVKLSTISNYVIDHSLSSFAEALRSAKLAADLALPNKQCKIIGVVSSLPGEGKSTIAINFAELLANQGSRTILIDGDLRNPGTTRAIGRHAQAGLLEALVENVEPSGLLLHNPRTKLSFMPAVIKHRIPHSSELLASNAMRSLLTTFSSQADYVVIDLPPLGPVVDARAIASRIDAFVFVAEWGSTTRRVARQLLSDEDEIRRKCLGVILNKVDQEKMKLYRSYGSTEYYYSEYSKYYQNE